MGACVNACCKWLKAFLAAKVMWLETLATLTVKGWSTELWMIQYIRVSGHKITNDMTNENVCFIACLELYFWKAIYQLAQDCTYQIALSGWFIVRCLHPNDQILVNLWLHIRKSCLFIEFVHSESYTSTYPGLYTLGCLPILPALYIQRVVY